MNLPVRNESKNHSLTFFPSYFSEILLGTDKFLTGYQGTWVLSRKKGTTQISVACQCLQCSVGHRRKSVFQQNTYIQKILSTEDISTIWRYHSGVEKVGKVRWTKFLLSFLIPSGNPFCRSGNRVN